MSIEILPYAASHVEAVMRFNERLKAGGVTMEFPTSPVPRWLPKIAVPALFQEYFLAVENGTEVRGAYSLKHQDFRILGETVSLADFHSPISESVVKRAYAPIGGSLLLDAQRRQPLLFGLGMGSYDEAATRLYRAVGWSLFTVPFYFRILRPFRFLRQIEYLRKSIMGRGLAEALAWTGLGWLGVTIVQGVRGKRGGQRPPVVADVVDDFGPWADDLWNACRDEYTACAVRDRAVLQTLYPRANATFIRLRVRQADKTLGWAVLLNTQMSGHRQFGGMRVGSIVDCFASPGDAGYVVRAAQAILQQQGADLLVSNQLHAAWCRALSDAGFLRGPSNFILGASAPLTRLLRLDSPGARADGIHVNRGDGEGPANL